MVVLITWILKDNILVVTLIQSVNIFQRSRKGAWHLLVQILVVPVFLLETGVNELICRRRVDIVLKPGQVELVHAETEEVEQRLNVVDRAGSWMHIELSDRSEH